MTAIFSRRFGVEFEFGVNEYTDDVSCAIERSTGWRCHPDCGGVELKTPPSSYRQWRKIKEVAENEFDDYNAYTGDEWGTHIHLSNSDLTRTQKRQWWHFWLIYERVMFGMVKPERRYGDYCTSIFGNNLRAPLANTGYARDVLKDTFDPTAYAWRSRTSLTPESHYDTTEIRIHHSTLDVGEIKEWVELMQILLYVSRFQRIYSADSLWDQINTMRALPLRRQRNSLVRHMRKYLKSRYLRVMGTIDRRLNHYAY